MINEYIYSAFYGVSIVQVYIILKGQPLDIKYLVNSTISLHQSFVKGALDSQFLAQDNEISTATLIYGC